MNTSQNARIGALSARIAQSVNTVLSHATLQQSTALQRQQELDARKARLRENRLNRARRGLRHLMAFCTEKSVQDIVSNHQRLNQRSAFPPFIEIKWCTIGHIPYQRLCVYPDEGSVRVQFHDSLLGAHRTWHFHPEGHLVTQGTTIHGGTIPPDQTGSNEFLANIAHAEDLDIDSNPELAEGTEVLFMLLARLSEKRAFERAVGGFLTGLDVYTRTLEG